GDVAGRERVHHETDPGATGDRQSEGAAQARVMAVAVIACVAIAHSIARKALDEAAAGADPALMGRYELLELLRRGGLASIYKALDRSTGREVALKLAQLEA